MKKSLIQTLTAALALGSATADTRVAALDRWISDQVPALVQAAQALIQPPFDPATEVAALANAAVKAAQELKGIFSGMERAKIAQSVLVYAVQEALPDSMEGYVLPLLENDQVAEVIEAAFQRVFGKKTPAVVDAQDVEAGSIQ